MERARIYECLVDFDAFKETRPWVSAVSNGVETIKANPSDKMSVIFMACHFFANVAMRKLFNNDFSICMNFIDIDVRKLSFFCSLNFHVYASVDQYCVTKWILFLIFMNMRNLMRLNKETECRWWDEEKWNSIYLVVCHSWKKDRRSV